MASLIPHAMALPPPHLLLFELIASSAVVGLTPSQSWVRPAALPILSSCVYAIVQDSKQYMRPRWASLLGGFSFAALLQYIDLGLISRWNYEENSPSIQGIPKGKAEKVPSDSPLNRFKFGWNAMWSFRHINTPSQVRNVPPFSKTDANYIPSKCKFVLQQSTAALGCYIILDLLGARKPPANAAQIFNPDLVPIFSRLGSVTTAEIKLRALTIARFGLTFYFVIQGFQSIAAALTVGLGLSKIANWRPAFGSLTDAYSLKNVWGYAISSVL